MAVEDEKLAELGGLYGNIHVLAANLNGPEGGRAGKVAVPQIVVHHLVVPNALTGSGIERNDAIGEKVRAQALAAVEIEGRGARGNKYPPALLVERHSTPIVGAARGAPRVTLPRVIAELSGAGKSVKDPRHHTRADVESANVARCGRAPGLRRTLTPG